MTVSYIEQRQPMAKQRSLAIILFSGLLAFGFHTIPSFFNNRSLSYQGIASDLQSGKVSFTEDHEEFLTDSQSPEIATIQYRDPSGEIIVKKRIDYSHSLWAPDFMQEDLRDGYTEGARVVGEEVELTCRKDSKHASKTKRIKIPSPVVIDGGFNQFLKQHWDQLASGATIQFNFAAPSQLDYYAFRVYLVKQETANGVNGLLFKMEPESFLLRALLAPIYLKYNADTRRLQQYEGITTINDARGKSLFARIVYPVTGP